MSDGHPQSASRLPLFVLVSASGLAGLTWEVLWQHHAGLALGVSAFGTAITLACTMAGMAVGSLGMGRILRDRAQTNPLRLFAALEGTIGLAGLTLAPCFQALERLDGYTWQRAPQLAPFAHAVGIAVVLALPTVAMGATLPVFRLLSDSSRVRLSSLYGLNTLGAAIGVPVGAFVLLPALGVSLTGEVAACVNLLVALAAILASRGRVAVPELPLEAPAARADGELQLSANAARLVVFVTGFATFLLEVAWFRSLRAAFFSTTDGFAVMLTAVLLPLAVGARLARVPKRRSGLALALGAAGALALVVSPVVERFDTFGLHRGSYWATQLSHLGVSLAVIGAPVLLIGIALPWLLDHQPGAREASVLYSVNTIGAVLGSLAAGWLLLPAVGAVRTAWLAALLLSLCAVVLLRGRVRAIAAMAGAAGLAGAIATESGVGRTRVQGVAGVRVLASAEGPDSTVSVVETAQRDRLLYIDGFQTSGEGPGGRYMAWMGRLPMLLHQRPARALVICFGTGQTANAVRREGPEALDIIELSPAVIAVAPLFLSNEDVLADPRVNLHLMDGRAWLRRSPTRYDVVTLEPMAPQMAGTNSLYSAEFYELVAARLNPSGVVAQWLPIHILAPEVAAAITRTFVEAFPDAVLWVHPANDMGILLGRREPRDAAGAVEWPGLQRPSEGRDLPPGQIVRVALSGDALRRYAHHGTLITDDNQFLAYGPGRRKVFGKRNRELNLRLIQGFSVDGFAPGSAR